MEYQALQNFIGGLGFPIFACIALGYYINTTQKEMIKTLNKVNKTLTAFASKLGIDEEDEDDE